MGFIKEFKEFALKGNVMDMAVGVIIGGAFGKIVNSLVADIIMPPIGLILGGADFTDMKWVLKPATLNEAGEEIAAAVTLNYGNFIQISVDFIILALAIFLMIKLMNNLKRKREAPAPAPAEPPAPTKEELLLGEIRDLLKQKNSL